MKPTNPNRRQFFAGGLFALVAGWLGRSTPAELIADRVEQSAEPLRRHDTTAPAQGLVTTYTYEPHGRVTSVMDPEGKFRRFV